MSYVAQLAAAENLSDEELNAVLVALAKEETPSLDDQVVSALAALEPPQFLSPELKAEWDKWRLAHLKALANSGLDREELLDSIDQLWAAFGYPADMEQTSRYYATSAERAAGYQFEDPKGERPVRALNEVIDRLQRSLTRSRDN